MKRTTQEIVDTFSKVAYILFHNQGGNPRKRDHMKTKIKKIISFEERSGTCDHCGTGIKYSVTVLLEDGKKMVVGRTCAKKDFLTTGTDKRMLNMTPAKYKAREISGCKKTIEFMKEDLAGFNEDRKQLGECWAKTHIACNPYLADRESDIAKYEAKLENLLK